MKGAKTLKPPVIFGITQKAALLNDTPTEAGIDGACHLVKLFQLHPMKQTPGSSSLDWASVEVTLGQGSEVSVGALVGQCWG